MRRSARIVGAAAGYGAKSVEYTWQNLGNTALVAAFVLATLRSKYLRAGRINWSAGLQNPSCGEEPLGENRVMNGPAIGELILRILRVAMIAYLVILVLARVFESHLIFFPNEPGRLDGDWHPENLPTEDVWLQTSDGTKLHSWWIPAEGAKFTFLAFHGNAGNIANRADIYRFLQETPANVLAVEYRGYGRSEGSPSETGLYRDADAAYRYLTETRKVAPATIISFGQSLGTAVAARLAAHSVVGGVVLEAPFPSLSAMARRVFWFIPGIQVAVITQFRTDRQLANIHVPVLVIHCSEDPVIPAELEEQVYDAAKTPKQILLIDGRGHEEGSLIAPEQYRAALLDFLGKVSGR